MYFLFFVQREQFEDLEVVDCVADVVDMRVDALDVCDDDIDDNDGDGEYDKLVREVTRHIFLLYPDLLHRPCGLSFSPF